MSAPMKPWESSLQNSSQVLRNVNLPKASRNVPVLPPRPQALGYNSGYNSYSPYSNYGNSFGGYNSYGGFGGMPYRGSVFGGYNNYGGYGTGYGMYGMGAAYGSQPINDAESRFIQFAEERSRNTFASVESIVRAFNSMAMMLDNTFFAMTSSFRAILGVADNFGRLRTTFGHIWHALNIFRLVKWMYRKLLEMVGVKVARNVRSQAWREALSGSASEAVGSGGSSWSAIAFLGMILSAPYFISKFLPKYEDNLNPEDWKSKAIPAIAVFPFSSQSPNELSFQENETILIAPKSIQDQMKLMNSGWAYATCNGRNGVIPLTYIKVKKQSETSDNLKRQHAEKQKRRVSFGENQVFEIEEENESNGIATQFANDFGGVNKQPVGFKDSQDAELNSDEYSVVKKSSLKNGDCNVVNNEIITKASLSEENSNNELLKNNASNVDKVTINNGIYLTNEVNDLNSKIENSHDS